jgi:ankyrin repeat protein
MGTHLCIVRQITAIHSLRSYYSPSAPNSMPWMPTDGHLCTPLLKYEVSTAELLLSRGADIQAKDNSGCTPLHTAAFEGRGCIVDMLLSQGADPNATDKRGFMPLHRAAGRAHASVIASLLSHGADVHATVHGYDARTALHLAASCEHGSHLASIDCLLAYGADVDVKDSGGYTPLHLAAREGILPVVKSLLLRHHANAHEVNMDGVTALMLACDYGHPPVACCLLASGAHPHEASHNP